MSIEEKIGKETLQELAIRFIKYRLLPKRKRPLLEGIELQSITIKLMKKHNIPPRELWDAIRNKAYELVEGLR